MNCCCCFVAKSFLTLCHPVDYSTPGFLSFTFSRSLLKFLSIESVMLSDHLIFCHPLLLLPSILPSIRVFYNLSVLRITKVLGLQHQSNEYSGLISFSIDWFDLLAVQGTLKSLLQHHSSKASVLQCSAFFMIQLSHSYITTGKIITLTRWAFVSQVMPLLFNTLSRLIIASLPRSKHIFYFRGCIHHSQ